MPEQENLEKEALALEALQEISGGLSAAGIKSGVKSAGESIKKGCKVVAKFAKENPAKAAALVTTLVGIEELARGEYKHGGRLFRDLLKDEGDPAENLKKLSADGKLLLHPWDLPTDDDDAPDQD